MKRAIPFLKKELHFIEEAMPFGEEVLPGLKKALDLNEKAMPSAYQGGKRSSFSWKRHYMSEDVRGKAMPSGKNESIAKKSYCCCEDNSACDQKWQCLRFKRQRLLLFGRCLQISYVLPLRDEGNAFCFEKINKSFRICQRRTARNPSPRQSPAPVYPANQDCNGKLLRSCNWKLLYSTWGNKVSSWPQSDDMNMNHMKEQKWPKFV